jgi:AcrR family transcriptional regulator
MSTAYELGGRTRQKQRTRAALVDAARALVARGLTPTLDDVAADASISRTTAYRYFPNQRLLLAAAHPETETDSLLPPDAPDDPGARLDLVVRAFTRLIVDTEAQQRTMLRLSLEADADERSGLPLRQGRAIRWIEEALEPLRSRIDDAQLRKVVLAIRSSIGIEALTWLTDIGGLSRDEAAELMRSTARAIYQAAIAGLPDAPS